MSEISQPNRSRDPVRFVVLKHDEPGGGHHFDLMIEQGDSLATWRCPVEPENVASTPLTLHRLPNHRVHYLTYEGQISGDRGSVTRHDKGMCTVLRCDDAEWEVEWSGENLSGRYALRKIDATAQSWLFESLAK